MKSLKILCNRGALLLLGLTFGASSQAAEYVIDGTGAGMHSFVQFRAVHMGVSSLWGRLNDIQGTFTYDASNIEASHIEVTLTTDSLDTNHAERDAHFKTADYFDAEKYPTAHFVSTSVSSTGDDTLEVTGDMTIHGVTKEVTIDTRRIGEGDTFFGDYRVGFEGKVTIDSADFGFGIAPVSTVDLILSIEGIRQ